MQQAYAVPMMQQTRSSLTLSRQRLQHGSACRSGNRGHRTPSMVGTFYRTPSPDAKVFIEVGQKVNVGDTLRIVEARNDESRDRSRQSRYCGKRFWSKVVNR